MFILIYLFSLSIFYILISILFIHVYFTFYPRLFLTIEVVNYIYPY
jgi:hypothetical protein